jgi:hypothetical protein
VKKEVEEKMKADIAVGKGGEKLVGFCGHCGGGIEEKGWQMGKVAVEQGVDEAGAPIMAEVRVKLHRGCYKVLAGPRIISSMHNRRIEVDFERGGLAHGFGKPGEMLSSILEEIRERGIERIAKTMVALLPGGRK